MGTFTWSCFAVSNFLMAIVSGPLAPVNLVVGLACLAIAVYSGVKDVVEIKKVHDEVMGKK